MDNKIVFVRTSKGDETAKGRAGVLAGDIRRALLMVDGTATVGELCKRAAPSLRNNLESLLLELAKTGFIQDSAQVVSAPKIITPPKIKQPTEANSGEELDFTAAFRPPTAEELAAEAAKLKVKEEAKAAAEAARLKAEQEARAAAERKAQEEAERKAKEEVERKAREAAEIERRIQAESESKSKSKSESENTGAHKAAEAAAEEFRQQAEQHLADAHEAEKASYVAEVDGDETSQARQQAEAALLQSAMELAEAKVESDDGGNTATKLRSRSTSATVLFFDVVGYTKQSISKQIEMKKQFNLLLSECLGLLGDVDPIILDTGDGAAVGFLQHPEDAIEVAVEFRKRVLENRRKHHRDLQVRTGIHLGPVNIVKDMNGQSNLLGDGINDAQRVMSFAGIDQIYISRSYYDFISRLSDEFAEMFIYRGEQKDKHNRSHAVYEYSEAGGDSPIGNLVLNKPVESTAKIKLEPFNISMPEAVGVVVNQPAEAPPAEVQPKPQPKPPQKPPKPIPNRSELEETSKSPKFVEKGYIPSADEVSSMAAAQAKAWADAEKRAQELAQGRLESSAQQATTATEAKPSKPRKPLPWGKIAIEAVLLLLIALFVGPHFLPTKDYAVKVEQLLESQLQQPVHIEKLAVRLLPSPSMELSAVAVGESVAVKIEQVKIDFALSSLWSSTKKINKLVLQGAEVNGAALQPLSQWLQQIAPNPQYPITRIEFAKSKFEFGAIQFADIAGNLEFDSSGSFSHATLQGSNDKFTMEMKAAENKTLLSLRVRDSVIPLLPNWQFSELNASGELTADELIVSDIDSRIAGGMLQGNGRLNWRSGWRAEGSLAAKTITLENISSILMGDMDGSARFTMQSDKLDALTDSVRMDGSFIVSKGTINGMDFVETTRLRSSNNIPGGRTHFDEAGGDLSLSGKVLSLRGMKMKAGVLSATGYVDIADDHLSGRVISELSIRAEMGSVPLQLGGTLGIPELKAVR
ncbi:MAG: AsmA family protein [Pseudomonadota bacterium]